MTLTHNQASQLERLSGKSKISRKQKKLVARLASGWKCPKRPRKVSAVQKLRRKEKKDIKAKGACKSREIRMIEYLVKSGWTRSGLAGEVWILGAWKDGYDDCKTTLYRAYRIQLKLESQDYERPVGMDDDLMENL